MRGQGSAWKGRGSRGGGDDDGPSKQICLWWANARLKQQQMEVFTQTRKGVLWVVFWCYVDCIVCSTPLRSASGEEQRDCVVQKLKN